MNDSPTTTARELALSEGTSRSLPETSGERNLGVVAHSGIAGFALAFLASMLAKNFIFVPLYIIAAPVIHLAAIAGIPATPGVIGCFGFALYALYAALITRPQRTRHRVLAAVAVISFHAISFAALPLLPRLGFELM